MALQSLVLDEDLLLDEYNHRLFNTIHIIAVEISKCARAVEATEMRPTLLDLGERLQALAGLHRLLAVGDRRGLLEDHCRELCILLVKVFGREDVTPWVQMEDIPLSCEQSLKIALIVVELVMNCLKHSLTNGNGGTIWIDLRRSFCGLELSVCDSLRAPPKEGVTPRILAALARSLQGEVFVLDRDGYTAGVRIPHAALGGPPISRFSSAARRPATQRAQTLSAAQFEPVCDL